MSTPAQPPASYRIRIRGHLDQADNGTTELAGPLADQAALSGLLARLRDLGATLLLVEHLPDYGPGGRGTQGEHRRRRAAG